MLDRLTVLFLALPTTIFDNGNGTKIDPNDPNTGGLNAVSALLHNAINLALFLAGGLAIIFFIVGGLRYVISNGNPSNTKTARETMIYALVGLGVSAAAFAIVNYVIKF